MDMQQAACADLRVRGHLGRLQHRLIATVDPSQQHLPRGQRLRGDDRGDLRDQVGLGQRLLVAEGAILPFGGYKGGLLAMMVELLSCALLGEEFGCEASKPRGPAGSAYPGGELLIAIDPDHFGDRDGWIAHAEVLFAAMTAEEGVRLPAARRYAARARSSSEGVAVPASLLAEIRDLADAG